MNANEILAAFNNLPLPARMRVAAGVLDDATRRHKKTSSELPVDYAWRSANLRYMADKFQEEDAQEARKLEDLARVVYEARGGEFWEDRSKPTLEHDIAAEILKKFDLKAKA